MLLKYFYDEHLAHASYLLACPVSGEALVIDPARDITPYLHAASQRNLRIVGAAETHIHADYISGGRELAAATDSTLYISGHGEGDLAYRMNGDGIGGRIKSLTDGEVITLGNVKIEVLHTPGHTPEHIVYLVSDTSGGINRQVGMFSGDCLFVGDVGRPDLLEAAVGVVDSAEHGAHDLFKTVERLKTLPDYLQVWPSHGAGSACGKALGDVPSTVLGYEKLYNPAFQHADAGSFTAWLLDGQPPVPRYFAQMKRVNQVGAALTHTLTHPEMTTDPRRIAKLVDTSLVIDTRERGDFAQAHIPGTINIPASEKSFNTWAGWYVSYDTPTYIVANAQTMPSVIRMLRAIGVDNIPNYIAVEIARAHNATLEEIDAHEAASRQERGGVIVDVRNTTERAEQFIANSRHIPMGEILQRVSELPPDRDIIIQCGSGSRSGVVASLLKRHGFKRIVHLRGGLDAWRRAGLAMG